MSSRSRRAGLLAATVAALLAAAPARAADKLILLLDWYVNPDHAQLIVAKEKGFFADEGLDVELIAPSDPSDPPKLVAAGKADVAVTYQPQLVLQVEQGLPLRRFATLVATPLNCLAVLADGPVKTLADLKGKRIGYSVAGFEDTLLAVMLRKNGLDTKDVTLVNVNFSLVPSLLSGQVDAVIGAFRNVELVQMARQKRPGRAFPVEDEGIPLYDELILVAPADKLGDARLPRLVAALERATAYLHNHPEESWAAFAKAHPDLADDQTREMWNLTVPRFAHSPGALDTTRYARMARFMADQKLVKEARPTADYAVALQPPR
jgi:putative hydroxymethylpyrimidine transport system substrate-binding protein